MLSKKIIINFLIIISLNVIGINSFAIAPTILPEKTSVLNSHLKDQMRINQMKLYANMTVEEYGKLRGKKLNFFERLSFKISQRRMRIMLKAYNGDGPTTLSKISWLIKGLILGPIALILGYILLKDEDRELIKWIWFGFIGFAAIVIIALLTL